MIARMGTDGTTTQFMAKALMANLCRLELASGHNHIYRGLLSMRGEALLGLCEYFARSLHACGGWSDEMSSQNRATLRDEIKEAA
jgi:hypothetical protein